jgi:16S rRNA C1402 N4-methylase RsmH
MSSANTTVLSQEEYDQRRKLWEGIKSLIKSEQEELYRILKRNEVEITENSRATSVRLRAAQRIGVAA